MKQKSKEKKWILAICTLIAVLLLSANMYSQTGNAIVRGQVKDAAGETVIGASVVVKGTTTGTVTDVDGLFELNAPVNGTIVISYLGFVTQEIPLSGRKTINVVLLEDQQQLDEVVVIGYGSVKKSDATGSVTAIKVDEKNKGLATTAQDLLAGKIAGVSVSSSGGRPGDGATIRIRGGSSLNAVNDPLIIVDGVFLSNDLSGSSNFMSTINPSDIETFTVLKDASATAIYGSRASNGVILITTKKGTSGKPKVAYNGNVSVSTNRKSVEMLDAGEYRQYVTERFAGTSQEAVVMSKLGSANTDWLSEVLRTAVSTDHNVSVYGSVGRSLPYRTSLGFTNEEGILRTSRMQRFTGSLSLTPSFFEEHLKLNINGKGMFSKSRFGDVGAIGSALSFDPTQPVMNGSKWGGYFSWTDTSGELSTLATKNPVALINDRKDQAYVRNFIGNIQTDYKLHFFPDVHLNLNLGLDVASTDGQDYKNPNGPIAYNEDDQKRGSRKRYENFKNNQLLELFAQYQKEVPSISSKFDVMGGYSWQHYKKTSDDYTHWVSTIDDSDLNLTSSNNNYKFLEYYLLSYFGRFNYTFNNKYLFTFTMRRDGSSRFADGNRWGTFPSMALAWRAKEESFLRDVDVLSDLKLRLGWGMTGQQDLGDDYYYSVGSYESGKDYGYYPMGTNDDGSTNWVYQKRPKAYNPNLKWETTRTWNAGIDYGFLNNRINGALDIYFRETKDLLNREAPVVAGVTVAERMVRNIGTLENNGVEFSINARPIVSKDLEWSVGFNISYNKGKITELLDNETKGYNGQGVGDTGGDGKESLQRYITGYAPRTFYVYEQVYDGNGKPLEGIYVDRNKDGVIDENDLYLHKKPAADVLMGFNTKVTYKNWDLGFNGRISLGNYVYNAQAANGANISSNAIYNNGGFLSNIAKSALETNFGSKYVLSDYYVQNGSYLKIDNITLGYALQKLAKRNVNARVYATVQNPFVITKYDGVDPEVNDGIDYNFYPRPLMFILGVNLNF